MSHLSIDEVAEVVIMSKLEFISPEGLRLDGRRANELRCIKCRMGVLTRADGSAYFEQGNTKVLAAVFGPQEVRRGKGKHDAAIVTCEYDMATFSTGERKAKSKGNRRAQEISLVIRQTFEDVILVDQFPSSEICIYVQVLQADGGTRCACINAVTLACIDAGIPMKDLAVACSAGCIDNVPILDLNYLEDSARGVDMPVALLPKSDRVVMLQMDYRADLDTFKNVLELASEGCKKIYEILLQEIRRHHRQLAGLE